MMRRYIVVLFAIVFSTVANALQPTVWNARYQQYIDKYKDLAIAEMQRYGIPASITMAQGVLESGAGNSELTLYSNNHFGIKCHEWTGRKVYKDDDEAHECFRAYDSAFDSYEDHSRFLKGSPRYQRLFRLSIYDYKGWANGLRECGYATNPHYGPQLIGIIECYHLDELDHARGHQSYQHKPQYQQGRDVSHTVLMCNKRYYVVAKKGDTFSSIAGEFETSARRLAEYNERDKNDVLRNGDIVFLQKKRSKADKSFKGIPHIVKPGQSLYDIAQMYGVRLDKLVKKNHLKGNMGVHAGDRIIVY